jgi:acetyltransferase-like isoleucine patch superfamily enzyme
MILEFKRKWTFDKSSDRLGPDLPFTHWRLYFKSLMLKLCKKKFRNFSDTSDFRPGAYAICCSKISIGQRVVIRPGSMLFADTRINGAKIIIEDDVLIGSGVHIYTGNHAFDNIYKPIIDQGHSESREVIVKKGSWIGANVILLPGVIIGENTVIGAGSVVTKSMPSRVIAAGNPAKIIRYLEEK